MLLPVVTTGARKKGRTVEKLTIGGLAERIGIGIETVRYYERIGIMPKPRRTQGGRRSYEADHIKRLTFIRQARGLGFSIDDIRALLEFSVSADTSCGDVEKLATQHLQIVRKKLADLTWIERRLTETVAKCSKNSSPSCPVLDVLQTYQEGQGPIQLESPGERLARRTQGSYRRRLTK